MKKKKKKNPVIKVLLENETILFSGPSSNPTKTIEKCNPENEIYSELEFISP